MGGMANASAEITNFQPRHCPCIRLPLLFVHKPDEQMRPKSFSACEIITRALGDLRRRSCAISLADATEAWQTLIVLIMVVHLGFLQVHHYHKACVCRAQICARQSRRAWAARPDVGAGMLGMERMRNGDDNNQPIGIKKGHPTLELLCNCVRPHGGYGNPGFWEVCNMLFD